MQIFTRFGFGILNAEFSQDFFGEVEREGGSGRVEFILSLVRLVFLPALLISQPTLLQ